MNVVCFGDSNTYGYNPYAKFGENYARRWTDILAELSGWNVLNEGVNGREVPNEPAVPSVETDLFLVMLGTNDLLQLDTPEAAAERMKVFLSNAEPQKTVLIAPPAMVLGEWVQEQDLIEDSLRLAQLYRNLAAEMNIKFLNSGDWDLSLCFDGVHLSEESQEPFARKLYQELATIL